MDNRRTALGVLINDIIAEIKTWEEFHDEEVQRLQLVGRKLTVVVGHSMTVDIDEEEKYEQ